MLQDSEIHFEVLQEYSPSARAERIVLGNIKLNMAEFVKGSEETEEGVVRRYLMQESKINSTLKVKIHKCTHNNKMWNADDVVGWHLHEANGRGKKLYCATIEDRARIWWDRRYPGC